VRAVVENGKRVHANVDDLVELMRRRLEWQANILFRFPLSKVLASSPRFHSHFLEPLRLRASWGPQI